MGTPVRQIPNAPMGVPGSPSIPTQGVPGGGNYSTPTVRGADYGRAMGILGQTIPMLETPKPRTIDFQDYEAAAWARLGETGGRIGAAMADFAGNMAKANDEGNLARADNMMAQSFSDHINKMMTRPPGEWRQTWDEKELPKLMRHFDEMRTMLSPSGQAKLDVLLDNKLTGYGIKIDAGATKKAIGDADSELQAQQERFAEQNDFASVAQTIATRLANGFIGKGQAEQMLLKNDKSIQANALKQRTIMDPWDTEEYLNKVVAEGGMTKDYDLIGPDGIVAARDEARRRRITMQRDAMDAITEQALRDPTSLSPEEIQTMGDEARLPQEWINAAKGNWQVEYSNTPEGQAQFLQRQNDLYAAIRQWKPDFDNQGELSDESFDQYIKLDMLIRQTMPPGHIDRFTGFLVRQTREGRNNAKNFYGTKNRDIESSMLGRIQSLYDMGIIGDVNEMMKKGMSQGEAQRTLEMNRLELRDEARRIVENNPAIGYGEALRQLDEVLRDRYKDNPRVMELFQTPKPGGGMMQWLRNLFAPRVGANVITGGLGFRGSDSPVPRYGGSEDMLPPLAGAPDQSMAPRFENPIANTIATEAEAMGMDPRIPLLIAYQESRFNPATKSGTSSARGVFQFLDSDRQRYGGEGIQQGLAKVKENYNVAQKALGREPSPGEVYVVYYQGIGAGPRILKNPQGSFRGTLNSIKPGWANTVLKANPWLRNIRTNADFIAWSEEKMASGASSLGFGA